jgi:hypothetical protein
VAGPRVDASIACGKFIVRAGIFQVNPFLCFGKYRGAATARCQRGRPWARKDLAPSKLDPERGPLTIEYAMLLQQLHQLKARAGPAQ